MECNTVAYQLTGFKFIIIAVEKRKRQNLVHFKEIIQDFLDNLPQSYIVDLFLSMPRISQCILRAENVTKY